MSATKVCSKCKKRKRLDAFGKNRTRVDGLSTECLQCRRDWKRVWWRTHKEQHYASSLKWRRKNPDTLRGYHKRYAEKQRDWHQRFKARKKGVTVIEFVDRVAVYRRDRWRCWICNKVVAKSQRTLDHVIPLAKNGPHTMANVKLAHYSCNSSRQDRMPEEAVNA